MGVAAMACMASGIVLAKPALERGALVEVTWVRLVAGVAGQVLWLVLTHKLQGTLGVFRPQRVWRTLVPATVLGTYVSMLCWIGGFKWAEASVAAILNQTNTVAVLFFSWLFLGEALGRRKLIGCSAAVLGACLIVAGEKIFELLDLCWR